MDGGAHGAREMFGSNSEAGNPENKFQHDYIRIGAVLGVVI
jgi:hypothetical protein